MAVQNAISFLKTKAYNDIVHVLKSPTDCYWQGGETPDSYRMNQIENIIRTTDKEIEKVKLKYKKKIQDAEQGVQVDGK